MPLQFCPECNQLALDIPHVDYLEKIGKIKLPNTKIQLLQQLLAKAIGELRKVNQVQGIGFEEKAFYDI